MTANFQETLKALGKQAKKEAAEREAEAKAKKQAEDVDFSKCCIFLTEMPFSPPSSIWRNPCSSTDSDFTDDTICTVAIADWVLQGCNDNLSSILQGWCRAYPCPKGVYGGRFSQWIE